MASTYYVDSNAAGGGNGAIGTPYNSVAALNAAHPTLSAGDTVNFKRGSVFRETLTVPSSGSSGNVITYQDYGSGAKPVLKGSDVVGGWSAATSGASPYAGSYWQASVTTQPQMVFQDGNFLYQGAGATTLNNLEWFWSANVLYVRDDAGSSAPAGTVEASKRNNCVTESTKDFLQFTNLKLMHDNSIAFSFSSGGPNITLTGVEWQDCWQWLNSNSTSGAAYQRCLFDLNRQTGTTNNPVNLSGAGSTHAFSYCLFRRSRARVFRCGAALTLNLDNCTFAASDREAISNASGSAIALRNCALVGLPVNNDLPIITSSAGTNTTADSLTQRSGTNGRTTGWITGTVTDTRPLPRWKAPKFAAGAFTGLWSVVFDDANWTQTSRCANALRAALGSGSGKGVTTLAYPALLIAADWTAAQALVNQGDDVAAHGRWHFDLSTANGFSALQYTGAGSAASLSIAGSPLTLTTTCTGAAGDNLSINLGTVGNLTALRAAIIANGKYTATLNAVSGGFSSAPANYLAAQSVADIKTAAVVVTLDLTQNGTVYAGEIAGSKSDVEANLTAAGGGAYACRSLIWPQGGNTAAAIARSVAVGLKGSRIAAMGSQRMIDLPLFQVGTHTGPQAPNVVVRLLMETLGTDSSGLANTFTNNGVITQSGTGVRQQTFAASLNGTTQYFSRTSAVAGLDYTSADWLFAVAVRPTSLASEKTVWFHGTDASNYHRVYLDTNGAVHYEIVAGGSQVVHVYTSNNRVAANTNTDLCVRQWNGKIELLWGQIGDRYADTIDATATVTTSITPANYTDRMLLGAGWNYGGPAAEKFFGGFLDDMVLTSWTVSNLYAQVEAACAAGAWQVWMVHPGDGDQADLFKLLGEALALHPLWAAGKLLWKTFGDALDYLYGNGAVTGDGLRVRWRQSDAASYVPAAGSPLVDAGAVLGYSADLAGTLVPQGSAPDVGAYESSAASGGGRLLLKAG